MGVDRSLIDPLQIMLMDNADTTFLKRKRAQGRIGTTKPSRKVYPLAYAAAAVSILKDKHGEDLQDALAEVARASGISKSQLKTFRDNLSRGGDRIPKAAAGMYRSVYDEMRDLTYQPSEILIAVKGIGRFVG
ncbi:hypothetical protein CDV49_19075 [Haematobacter genomosp. 1]|uniref:Uncharacterized protein n=2 Tax=Haematobacter genomosp. 1 TaxID=366618 RepID=A0A212A6K8_9RHOB|nr:hypothetical protein CDV49_19075 [Haematobacter genomosp. 1]